MFGSIQNRHCMATLSSRPAAAHFLMGASARKKAPSAGNMHCLPFH